MGPGAWATRTRACQGKVSKAMCAMPPLHWWILSVLYDYVRRSVIVACYYTRVPCKHCSLLMLFPLPSAQDPPGCV